MMTRSVASAVAVLVLCVIGVQTASAHVGNRVISIFELTDADLAVIDLHDGLTCVMPGGIRRSS